MGIGCRDDRPHPGDRHGGHSGARLRKTDRCHFGRRFESVGLLPLAEGLHEGSGALGLTQRIYRRRRFRDLLFGRRGAAPASPAGTASPPSRLSGACGLAPRGMSLEGSPSIACLSNSGGDSVPAAGYASASRYSRILLARVVRWMPRRLAAWPRCHIVSVSTRRMCRRSMAAIDRSSSSSPPSR